MVLDPSRRRHQLIYQIAFGVVLLALYLLAGSFWPQTFPTPWLILGALYEQTVSGPMLEAIYLALQAILVGFLIAAVVGIFVGLIMGLNDYTEMFLDPYLNALYFMPFAAVIPAFIMWFGTGYQVRVIVVFSFALFPIAINTFEGAETIPRPYSELASSFNASTYHRVRHIVIPHELPYVLAGLRLGGGLAVRGLVVTELLVSVTGFGALINEWTVAFRMEGLLSVVLVLMAMGILFTSGLYQIEKRLIPWDVSEIET